jgi:hypothetical protein
MIKQTSGLFVHFNAVGWKFFRIRQSYLFSARPLMAGVSSGRGLSRIILFTFSTAQAGEESGVLLRLPLERLPSDF